MNSNVKLVKAFYKAMPDITNDLSDFFTNDFVISEAQDLPYGGVYRGRTAMRQLVDKINGMISVSDVTLQRFAASEDSVIATLRFDLMLLDGGKDTQYVAEEFLFRGDKICEVRAYYFDNALMHRGVAGS